MLKKYLYIFLISMVPLIELRGAIPVPIDFKELNMLAKVLDLTTEDIYPLWEKRMKQVLESNGMNIYSNAALVNSMFDCAKKYIHLK